MSYLEDCLLAVLQRRCQHPGKMVSVDILEGGGAGVEVGLCNRCGAVRLRTPQNVGTRGQLWRAPNPHLWRG
jgi:hypothetical protein